MKPPECVDIYIYIYIYIYIQNHPSVLILSAISEPAGKTE